jgi:hypothetical protein
MMSKKRLKAWANGEIDLEDMTTKEIKYVLELVFTKVTEIKFARPGVVVYGQHSTVQ